MLFFQWTYFSTYFALWSGEVENLIFIKQAFMLHLSVCVCVAGVKLWNSLSDEVK